MISSLLGGFLYGLNPDFPWYGVVIASLIQVLFVIFFIRDPQHAEK